MRTEAYALEDDRPAPARDDPDDPSEQRPRARLLAAALLAALVFLVYELTASPMAAAIAGGLKFGWDDLADGLWLLRRDPRRFRGALLMLVQAARGAYVASLVACGVAAAADLVMTLVGGLGGKAVPQAVPLSDLVIFALCAAGACVALTLAWLALTLASGQRVWAAGGVSKFRRRDEWPPRPRGRNYAPALIGATAYFLVAALAAAAMVGMNWQVPGLGGMPGNLSVAIALGVAAAFLGGWLGRKIAARWAEECWPDEHAPDAAY